MKQSQLLRQSEEVTYEQDVAIDANNEVTLGADVAFDLSGFDTNMGGTNLAGV